MAATSSSLLHLLNKVPKKNIVNIVQALEDEIGQKRVDWEEQGRGGGEAGEEETLDPRLQQRSQVENSQPWH